MIVIINALNNREIAIGIWLIIIFLWALSKKDVRPYIRNLLRVFFNRKIIIPLIAMILYIALMVVAFEKIGFWDISATKDTILWTLGSAIATYFSLNKLAQDNSYFKNMILDNLKFVLILEFILNLYPFSLLTELIIMPIISFIVMLNGFTESKPEYKQISKVLNFILVIFGLLLFAFTIKDIIHDFQNFASLKTLRDFFLPALFSIALLPFLYVMALLIQYEMFFNRIDFANKNPVIANYVKRRVFAACHINLSKLNKVSRRAGFPKVQNKSDVLEWVKDGNL